MYQITRDMWARLLGMGNTKINVDTECDYPLVITEDDYQRMHERGGIGYRVNTIYPNHCWELDPDIYEDEDSDVETEFEKKLKQLEKDHGLFSLFEQADIDAGIIRYGVILVGINDGKELKEPVEGITGKPEDQTAKQHELLYLRSFTQKQARITAWEENKQSHRFGKPTKYQIFLNLQTMDGSANAPTNKDEGVEVHWSRVVHICLRPGKETFHTPTAEPVYNHLLDLRKNYGGSAQMTWQGGFPGIAWKPANNDKDVQYEMDPVAIKQAMDDYNRGLKRHLAVEGLEPVSLQVQTYDPTAPIEVQLKAVAAIIGVPYRIFLGTEEAQLAGSQDQKNWNRRITRRQCRICTPRIIRPTIDLFISLGILPRPADDYTVKHANREEESRAEKVTTAKDETEALAKYTSGNVESNVPFREYLTVVLGWDNDVVDQVMEAREDQEAELEAQAEDDLANGLDPNTGLPLPDPNMDPNLPPDNQGGGNPPPKIPKVPAKEKPIDKKEKGAQKPKPPRR